MTFPVPPVGEGVDFSEVVRHRVTSHDYERVARRGEGTGGELPRRRRDPERRRPLRRLLARLLRS